jgi:hypothetical protein
MHQVDSPPLGQTAEAPGVHVPKEPYRKAAPRPQRQDLRLDVETAKEVRCRSGPVQQDDRLIPGPVQLADKVTHLTLGTVDCPAASQQQNPAWLVRGNLLTGISQA